MRYVFIVTYGRSGSTLLQALLNALPGYYIRGENNNILMSIFHTWKSFQHAYSLSSMIDQGHPIPPDNPWYGIENTRAELLAHEMVKSFINHVLCPPPDAQVLGFREIRYYEAGDNFEEYLNFIHMHFPNCRFIFNTRNHADVIKSGWWQKSYAKDPDAVMDKLTRSDTYFESYQAKYPDRSLLVRYDNYTTDQTLFYDLFEFLGETYDADLVAGIMKRRLVH